jgi:hypothetical protein
MLKLLTIPSCDSNRPIVHRGVTVIMGLALQCLGVVYGVLPAWAQTETSATEPSGLRCKSDQPYGSTRTGAEGCGSKQDR